ncbi:MULTISPECIES: hypothetical protein [unclassified Streptomyces]|uniref:hypothetical protein n=1 Tax=unclassified Streptomyces TaxID=2593676 RepID=UPI000938CB0E|nr:hypothetical protein [Streptomyces sp. TSRI0107]OKJ89476.1 hypothetical protein AMK31_05975 [Streptomyces sp. TSRI0107]
MIDRHADQLRRVLRDAEEFAGKIGDELAAEQLGGVARRRRHLARITERLTLAEMRGHAVAVRVALRRAAREGRTTTWGEPTLRIGAPLAALHPDDKVAVLVEADRETPGDRPLLSALVTAHGGGRPHRLYRQVLFNLDRPGPRPKDSSRTGAWHCVDTRSSAEANVVLRSHPHPGRPVRPESDLPQRQSVQSGRRGLPTAPGTSHDGRSSL